MTLRFPSLLRAAPALLLAASALAGPSFIPIPLQKGGTTGFSDDIAGDRKGGWIDDGPNDLGVLEPGTRDFIGVRFAIVSEKDARGRACIVLGGPERPWMAQSATVPARGRKGTFVQNSCLYLLHAAAGMSHPEAHGTVGTLTVVYADGDRTNIAVRAGIEAADWTQSTSYANAALAWTDYNLSTQVALFLSRFPLQPKPLRELRFAAGDSTWMVAGVTVGDPVSPRPLRWTSDQAITREFRAPEPAPSLPDVPDGLRPRNVVFCFGDGMGQGALDLASAHLWNAPGRLAMQQLPHATLVATHSADKPVTDSAAAATALACGRKTLNGSVGIDPRGRVLASLATLAHARGMGAAVLSNDALTGATPASFFAHLRSRREIHAAAAAVLDAGFDVILGDRHHREAFRTPENGGTRTDGRDIVDEMQARGYAYADDPAALADIPAGRPVFGLLGGDFAHGDTALADAADWAMRRLSANTNGFFLFVESTQPDHGGHGNNPELLVEGVVQVDWLVRQALDFAVERGDTLVIVTADHETGGVQAIAGCGGATSETVHFSSLGHTGAHVPLFAYGPGAERFSGVMDNTEVSRTLAFLLGLSFPDPGAVIP